MSCTPCLLMNRTGVWVEYKRYSSPSANAQFANGVIDSIEFFKDIIEDPETYDGTVVVPINHKTVARFNWLSHNWVELRAAFAHGALEMRTMHALVARRPDGTGVWKRIYWPLDVLSLYEPASTRTPLYTVLFYDQIPRALNSTATIFKQIPVELTMLTRQTHQRNGYRDDLFPGVFWLQGFYASRAAAAHPRVSVTNKFAFAAATVPRDLIDKIRAVAAPGARYRVLPADRCLDIGTVLQRENQLYPNPLTAKLRWHDLAPVREPFQHAWLVGLALCFCHVPPYVLLEIYDWLPVASAMTHRRKIDLIFAVQKSIRKAVGVREFRVGVEQYDNS